MAQSKTQKIKINKSKFPMWVIGIAVVLFVAITGYVIVRLSKAGGSGGTTINAQFSSLYGRHGAYKTKITKSNGGGTVDAWALPKDSEVSAWYPTIVNNYQTTFRTCVVAQRLNMSSTGPYPLAAISESAYIPGTGHSSQVQIGSINNYCDPVGAEGVPAGYNSSWYSSIRNLDDPILYVTNMSLQF